MRVNKSLIKRLLFIFVLSSIYYFKSNCVYSMDFNVISSRLRSLDVSFAKIYSDEPTYTVNMSTSKEQSISKIYSILSHYGLSNIQIAGLMGHWERESSNDATVIEGIYDEPFRVGARKAEAIKDITSYSLNLRKGKSLKWYRVNSSTVVCGIGIGQYTGYRGLQMIELSSKLGYDLFTPEFQLAVDTYYFKREGKEWYKTFKSQEFSSIKEAVYYSTRYHGGANPYGKVSPTMSLRVQAGEYYLNLFNSGVVKYDSDAVNKFNEILGRLSIE